MHRQFVKPNAMKRAIIWKQIFGLQVFYEQWKYGLVREYSTIHHVVTRPMKVQTSQKVLHLYIMWSDRGERGILKSRWNRKTGKFYRVFVHIRFPKCALKRISWDQCALPFHKMGTFSNYRVIFTLPSPSYYPVNIIYK